MIFELQRLLKLDNYTYYCKIHIPKPNIMYQNHTFEGFECMQRCSSDVLVLSMPTFRVAWKHVKHHPKLSHYKYTLFSERPPHQHQSHVLVFESSNNKNYVPLETLAPFYKLGILWCGVGVPFHLLIKKTNHLHKFLSY